MGHKSCYQNLIDYQFPLPHYHFPYLQNHNGNLNYSMFYLALAFQKHKNPVLIKHLQYNIHHSITVLIYSLLLIRDSNKTIT